MITEDYPLNTDDLAKGSIVSVEAIERAFSVLRGTDAYQLAYMRCSQYIAAKFRERGEIITTTQRNHSLVILSDEEVPAHNARMFKQSIQRAARSHVRTLGADRSQMTEETQGLHDRTLTVQGAQLSALSRARSEIVAAPRERSTPVLKEKASK